MTKPDIRISAELLKNKYNTDLGTLFFHECIRFGCYLKPFPIFLQIYKFHNVSVYMKKNI